jgi:acyl carrier protein
MAVADDVKAVIAEELDVPAQSVKDSANFESDFQADSLTVVELVMTIEDKFEIDIPEEDLEQLKTVGDLVTYIEGALARK